MTVQRPGLSLAGIAGKSWRPGQRIFRFALRRQRPGERVLGKVSSNMSRQNGRRAWLRALLLPIAVLWGAANTYSTQAQTQAPACASEAPPSEQLGQLFRDVQLEKIFADGKTFADLQYEESPRTILAAYQAHKDDAGFDLRKFVDRHFSTPGEGPTVPRAAANEPIGAYVARLWHVLRQTTDGGSGHSSLLALPHAYVVPGGRFRELYYWDSYFTMLGLEADGHHHRAVDMLKDFAFEIDCYGHVPNGNRSYYLSRSQPPFFSLMVDLVAGRDGDGAYLTYLPELRAEYEYWMDGAVIVAPGQGYRHVVRLRDGTILNRYWDDRAEPRDESYREDVETARSVRRDPGEVFRNIRAGTESGWDFSSRWLADGHTLNTIRTVQLLPVDLNCLLAHLEETLAKAYRLKADERQSTRFADLAAHRVASIRRLMWSEAGQIFVDYDWEKEQPAETVTAAGLFPLYLKVATATQADATADTVRRLLLTPAGIATTTVASGQQWDRPNGWAPLQWVAVVGLRAYDKPRLAEAIAVRWSCQNLRVYRKTGTLVEKYDLSGGGAGGGGGEYALQIGFGWTNGVLRALGSLYPDLSRLSPELCAASSTARQ
jgi:alpha,alpha-trehalase